MTPPLSNLVGSLLLLGASLLAACTGRRIVFGPPPGEDPANWPPVEAAASVAVAEWEPPALRQRISAPDADIGRGALALMAGVEPGGGRCSGCHAIGRPTLTRWRQLTDSLVSACLGRLGLSDAAAVDAMLGCFQDQAQAPAFSPSTFGIYSAAAHLPWFSFVFDHASTYAADPSAEHAAFVARVGMPRAGAPLTQTEFDLIAEWFARGLPDLLELVPEQDGGACTDRLDPRLAAHVADMSRRGWRARDEQVPLLMYGCDAGQVPRQCLAELPLARDTVYGQSWDPPGAARLRVLHDNSSALSSFWSRSSADGRYFASGLRDGSRIEGSGQLLDLGSGRAIGADFSYDPTFFPDNSGFMLQRTTAAATASTGGVAAPEDEAVICNQSVLAGDLGRLTGDEAECTVIGGRIGLYQQLAKSLDGEDYWVAHGTYAEDNGGFEPVLQNPSAAFQRESTTTLTPMINQGTSFRTGVPTRSPTPFQGDAMLSPSGRLLISRVQGRELTSTSDGVPLIFAEQSGYALQLVNTVRQGDGLAVSLEDIGRICVQGGKALVSYDERWMVLHHYVTAEDADLLGFDGPDDPAFANYLALGASNLHLVDLLDGSSRIITRMGPGQYALFPHFRADGWIYFVVRTLDQREYFLASDAAVLLEDGAAPGPTGGTTTGG